ncbi:MAG: DNA-3-methyladenine glycosylase 2 family protein [Pseudomonadota bacterium]
MNKNGPNWQSLRQKLRRSLQQACRLDPGLKSVIAEYGWPEPRYRNNSFETLVQVIVSQQLSTHAAAAIAARVKTSCRGNITWRKILNRSEQQLRDCGLSYRKIEYAKELAMAVKTGVIDFDELTAMTTEEVTDKLTAVRGFGVWTAEIYAMFALNHKDIYPKDDLALQVAVGRYYRLPERPTPKETAALSRKWSPHRTAVALLMWKYYGSTTLQSKL